jgi:radical SAM family uncharacterized protein/radical SAM-linked protein
MYPGYETILPQVEKPARYVGGETGAAPSPGPGDLRFVLCFPDLYEIGMSYTGLSNLYAALRAASDVAPARCFAPAPDMAEELRRRHIPLVALESDLPLREADVLGFSFPSPLNFSTALTMLELGGVPLLASDRAAADPLVVAGGQATFNPEPMAAFVDAVALGEGETVIVEIAAAVRAARAAGASREETLRRLGSLAGVYLPSWYEPRYEGPSFAGMDGRPGAPARVARRRLAATELLPRPPALVANLPPTHDRLAVEVMRGCLWGCRFCQAGMVTRPARERDATLCWAEAEAGLEATGATEMSFLALNACDYTALEPLIAHGRRCRPEVKLSLPAARISSYRGAVSEALAGSKRSQQTFAPEVGTNRLRRVINKEFTNEEVVATVEEAGRAGCQNVKLYFMVGLPTETDDDASAIGDLLAACRQALRKGLGRWGNLSASISPFVPQPHTPFQWSGLAPPEVLRRRLTLAKKAAPHRVKVEGEVGSRVLEACLARGDRRLGPVLAEAYRRGASFDAWRDRYEEEAWREAFEAAGFDMEAYAGRELPREGPLPWSHLDAGVTEEFLAGRCGACDDAWTVSVAPAASFPAPAAPPQVPLTTKRQRLQFTYAKTGRWRWLSHLELRRLVVAQLCRAAIPLTWSGGFSPKPRVILAAALPVGVEGLAECGEAYLREPLAPQDFLARVNRAGPFEFAAAKERPPEAPAVETTLRGGFYDASFAPLATAAERDPAKVVANVASRLPGGELPTTIRADGGEPTKTMTITSWEPEEARLSFELSTEARGALFDFLGELAGVSASEARAAHVRRLGLCREEEPPGT